jgi:hypothetical protein
VPCSNGTHDLRARRHRVWPAAGVRQEVWVQRRGAATTNRPTYSDRLQQFSWHAHCKRSTSLRTCSPRRSSVIHPKRDLPCEQGQQPTVQIKTITQLLDDMMRSCPSPPHIGVPSYAPWWPEDTAILLHALRDPKEPGQKSAGFLCLVFCRLASICCGVSFFSNVGCTSGQVADGRPRSGCWGIQ